MKSPTDKVANEVSDKGEVANEVSNKEKVASQVIETAEVATRNNSNLYHCRYVGQ